MSFHSHADKTHFHMKGFARGLALKTRHKAIRKWPNCDAFRIRVESNGMGISRFQGINCTHFVGSWIKISGVFMIRNRHVGTRSAISGGMAISSIFGDESCSCYESSKLKFFSQEQFCS